VQTVSELSDSSRQSYTAVNRCVDDDDMLWLHTALKDSASACGKFLSIITVGILMSTTLSQKSLVLSPYSLVTVLGRC